MKTVIFDMDGLLIDSEIRSLTAWRAVAKEYGLPDIDAFFPKIMGTNPQTRKIIFENFFGKNFDFQLCNETVRTLANGYEAETPIPLKKGARELLAYLRENGYKIGLASSSRSDTIKRRMEYHGIFGLFDTVVSGEAVTMSKPDPEIFLLCAASLGASPTETTVLEDSPNGIRAAHAAGMRPVMVIDLYAPEKEIAALAHTVCPSLLEVKEKFENGEL